jgi:hypothetical protein
MFSKAKNEPIPEKTPKEKAKQFASQFLASALEIAKLIETSKTEKEADEIWSCVLDELEDWLSVDDIWEYLVNWDKVEWKRSD